MVVVGIDLSLTKTGYVIIDSDKGVISRGIIKSKPSGESRLAEVQRIRKIIDEVFDEINKACPDCNPTLVVIEGLAFMARNTQSLVQLAGLSYYLRIQLSISKAPFMIVAPTSLKKFITGSGKGDKDQIMMKLYKEYGFEAFDNNEADSFGLAACGLAALGVPLRELTVPQKEVIKLLSIQL